jgi:hypothetical protein
MNTPDDPVSPYQPPAGALSDQAELPALAPHERSGAPKVFGVLSIIFASIELVLSTIGMLAGAATGAAASLGKLSADADKTAELNAVMHPLAKVYQGFGLQSLILFVMSALLLAIGIGQVRYRKWACRWSVYWGGAAIACVAALVAISLLVIAPAYAELFDAAARAKPGSEGIPGGMSGISTWFGGTFAVLYVILYTPYPAMMLLFFTRDHVRASMTQ